MDSVAINNSTVATKSQDKDIGHWKVFSLADAYAEREPVQYVVEGLLSLPSLSVFYGAPGTLKSFLVADMMISVACGQSWLKPMPGVTDTMSRKTKQVPVLWLDFDNGKRRTDDRFAALGRHKKVPIDTNLHYVSMPDPWLDMSKSDLTDELIIFVNRYQAKLVVIDNLGVVSGGKNEIGGEMIPIMSNLRRLAEATGAAIIIIHHKRKDSRNGKETRAGDAMRGHSSIEAAADLALLVERQSDSDTVTVKSTKSRDVTVRTFAAMFTYEHKNNSTDLETANFFGQKSEDGIEDAVISVLSAQGTKKQDDLIQMVKSISGAGLTNIRLVIIEMAKRSQIAVTGSRPKWYSLPKT